MRTPHDALAKSRAFLDEATENLTFAAHAWTLEEVCHGVGWALNALRRAPLLSLALGDKGAPPRAGALPDLLSHTPRAPGGAAPIVTRLDALCRTHWEGGALDEAEVEASVFAAWELYDAIAWKLGQIDSRVDGAQAPPAVERRTALKMLLTGAGGVLSMSACTKPEPTIARATRPTRRRGAAKAPAPPATSDTPIARVEDLPPMQWPTDDPFLFCAYHLDAYPEGDANFAPVASLAGRHLGRDFDPNAKWRMYHGRTVPGFPRHPHRGFETVTVVRSGMLDHADSMGAAARYGGGDVQWLTAGGGIQHAEMFPLLRADEGNPLELFQIWLNLPRADKMVPAHFTMLWSEKIPRVTQRDAAGKATNLTVRAGRYGDHATPAPPPDSWASKPESDLAIWEFLMEPGATFTLPEVETGTHRSLYVFRGEGATIGGRNLRNMQRAVIHEPGEVTITAGAAQTEILLLQAKPIGEPVAKRGPFVMNEPAEIRQAYADFQRTQFGGWPWPDNGPVHPGTKGRFARHIDGKLEEPG